MKWLKLYTEIARDPKMVILAFEDRWHYVAILCAKAEGLLDQKPELRDRMLAAHLGLSQSNMDEMRKRLVDVELIDDDWEPIGWLERQSADATGAARKRRQRAKERLQDSKEYKNKEVRSKNKEGSVTVTGQMTPFDLFWEQYPRKTKKQEAMRAFDRLAIGPDTLNTILSNIAERVKTGDFDRQEKRFIPHPSTYLNGKRWEDEVIAQTTTKTKPNSAELARRNAEAVSMDFSGSEMAWIEKN